MNKQSDLINELQDALCQALPYVEDAKYDPCYKSGSTVALENRIKRLIEQAESTNEASKSKAEK